MGILGPHVVPTNTEVEVASLPLTIVEALTLYFLLDILQQHPKGKGGVPHYCWVG